MPRPDRSFGIVLVRARVAEINENTIAHVLGDETIEPGDDFGDRAVIGADDLAQILGVKTGRERRRAHQIAEHHGQLPALGIGARRCIRSCRRQVCDRTAPRAAMASSNLRRWPIATTPISLRSSEVSFGSTSQSISLSRNSDS